MAITKLLTFDNRPDVSGETFIHPVAPLYRTGGLDKTANSLSPDLVKYLMGMGEPAEDEVRAVITALSAYDTFGPNKNGDAFFREDLVKEWEYPELASKGVTGPISLYETFEHCARPYKHHINRPNSPAYGKVLKAFWNPEMDRVELVVAVDRKLAPDIVERMEGYGDVATSMGFRAKYDVCLICNNKAKTRAQYCNHARREMLSVMPDGRIVAVRNPEGHFFDISFVGDPADITSRAVWVNRILGTDGAPVGTLQVGGSDEIINKTASALTFDKTAGVYLSSDLAVANGYQEKGAESKKKADLVKRVEGQADTLLSPADEEVLRRAVKKMVVNQEPLSPQFMKEAATGRPFAATMASLGVCGISPSIREAQYMALVSEGMPKTADRVWEAGDVYWDNTVEPIQVLLDAPDYDLVEKLASNDGVMTSRSLYPAWIKHRMEKRAFRNPYVPQRQNRDYAHLPPAIDPDEVRQGRNDIDGAGLMKYVIGLILGTRWAVREREVRQMARNNPGLYAQMLMGPDAMPRDYERLQREADTLGYARALRMHGVPGDYQQRAMYGMSPYGGPAVGSSLMMTAPISSYIRGVDQTWTPDLYPELGLLEGAMAKEAACNFQRRVIADHIAATSPAPLSVMASMSKNAAFTSDAYWVYDSPSHEALSLLIADSTFDAVD